MNHVQNQEIGLSPNEIKIIVKISPVIRDCLKKNKIFFEMSFFIKLKIKIVVKSPTIKPIKEVLAELSTIINTPKIYDIHKITL